MIASLIVILAITLFASFPMFLVLGLPPLANVLVYFKDVDPIIIVQKWISGVSPFPLIAVPLFIFAAEIMLKGELSARLSEVESAARSFAISGKQSHLDPFYRAAKAVPAEVEELKVLVRDDPDAFGALTQIEPVIARHVRAMKDMVDLGNKNLFRGSGQRKLTDQGNTLMEEIQTAFSALEKTQRAQLAEQQTVLAARAALGSAAFSISSLKMISAAPCGPMTAISAVGQA